MPYNPNRAIQFMPFNGLKGFSDLLQKSETPPPVRRELTEDRAHELDEKLQTLYKGETVVLTTYTHNGYVSDVYCIKEIDSVFKVLRTNKGNIPFMDIWEIETGY